MSAPAKVLREALDMVTQILPEAATMRPDYAKKLRSLLYVALAHAEMNSDRDAARYRAIRNAMTATPVNHLPPRLVEQFSASTRIGYPELIDAACDALISEGAPTP